MSVTYDDSLNDTASSSTKRKTTTICIPSEVDEHMLHIDGRGVIDTHSDSSDSIEKGESMGSNTIWSKYDKCELRIEPRYDD